MAIWREISPGDDGIWVYQLKKLSGTLIAALVPVDGSTITGVDPKTDYWLGNHPDTWPTAFTLDRVVRAAPTTASGVFDYTSGATTISKWHGRKLQSFVGTSASHAWSDPDARIWKAVVPKLRTTIDHFVYIIWNGSDFEWAVTTESTADYIDLSSGSFSFTEASGTITGVLATDV